MLAGRMVETLGRHPNAAKVMPNGVLAELRKLYYDTASADTEGSMAALRVMAPTNHILYGSDVRLLRVARGPQAHAGKLEIRTPTAPPSSAAMPSRRCRGSERHDGCCRPAPFPAVRRRAFLDRIDLLVVVEILIRVDVINRFIVPMPSDIIAAFPRVIVEEDVLAPLPADRRRGVLGVHPGHAVRRRRRRAAATATTCCGWPPRPGWRRWRRRRWC